MIKELKCCGRIDPIGVDKQNIRLSFALDGSMAVRESCVRVFRADSQQEICTIPAQGTTAWFPSEQAQELTAYFWFVEALTADGEILRSQKACFETGPDLWQGKWLQGSGDEGDVFRFRKEILSDTPIRKARLYICGLGYFVPMLNGKRLDESYFIPPLTNYGHRHSVDAPHIGSDYRVTYYTYDVTAMLQIGSNILQADVAGGYYSNREKLDYEPQPDFSFGNPCFTFQLYLEDAQGKGTWIFSDETVQVCRTPNKANLYSGDRVDFTCENTPWEIAKVCLPPQGKMVAPLCQGDQLYQVLTPIAFWETAEGTVYDFGRNHSGGLALTATASCDVELKVCFAEVCNADGTLNYETAAWHGVHNRTNEEKHIYQENIYRFSAGSHEIEPEFTWFCYRYVLIPACDKVEISNLRSFFICMVPEKDGHFRCSEEIFNRIDETFLQTLHCNMHSGIVMDCPHRERLPYTGDGKLVMKSACYSTDMVGFYYKWFRDLLDAQTKEGLVPNTAPYMGGGGGYAWGNAIATVSWQLFAMTGDQKVAKEGYEAVVRWLGYYESKRDEDYIIRSNSHSWMLGDWLAPEVVTSDVYYISTVCYLQSVKIALRFARCLQLPDWEKWEELCQCIKQGINRVFFDCQKRTYGNGVQGENMLALAEDIVPDPYREKMRMDLKKHYTEETNYHLDTGIVLTPMLIYYMTDGGLQDIAYQIMTAKTYPSYYNLMQDDTTFSEHWSKHWPDYYLGEPKKSRLVKGGGDLSHCHPMYGSVASWLYERVAGLDLSRLYEKIVMVKPCFMDHLAWAKADKKTAYGEVAVEWNCEKGSYKLHITIPEGLSAHCQFPAKCQFLKNAATGEIYYPDCHGGYDFTLNSGNWILMN